MNQFHKAKMGFYKVMIECDANFSLFELTFFFFFGTIYESHYIIQLIFNFFFLFLYYL